MIKVTFFDYNKSTILDIEYYKDSQESELNEDIEDHGREYTKVEIVPDDSEDYLVYKEASEKLYRACIKAMDADIENLKEELARTEPHRFSEDFERKMRELIGKMIKQ